MFGWFKSSNESKPTQEATWDAATMTMRQPSNTEEMSANQVVSQQPNPEAMKMELRGGAAPVSPASNAASAAAKRVDFVRNPYLVGMTFRFAESMFFRYAVSPELSKGQIMVYVPKTEPLKGKAPWIYPMNAYYKRLTSLSGPLSGVEQGDAKDAATIKAAATKNRCDCIVNTAGLAAMAPWGESDLPAIIDAVICAARDIGQERGTPLRVWFLAGLGLLDVPNTKYKIVDYLRIFPEYRQTWAKLQKVPSSSISWSILCPGVMSPLRSLSYPSAAEASGQNLIATADVPPDWSPKFLYSPIFREYLNVLSQVPDYGTALEDNADLIATDLQKGEGSEWIGKRVGVKAR
ncbi:hypothetical protein PENANT_c011G08084 [Penicillium antarcticum]|uniref:NAD(P)-binding domain-containing protein n=1 Tax=Penicillium antarcticum TaxID=416450 RepID=A0A1V6Q790_9EURO|nr:hypothetical protein PENANT_c011G08084 [Penicillium antarcticum]